MAFGQEAVEQLSREILAGYNLNTRLLTLLGGEPLDSRRQEAAVATIQELSGVFRNLMVSLFMIKSGDSSGGVVRTSSPEATITEGSVDQRAPAKHKRISRGELTPHRKVRGEVVREETTASPFEDVYHWRKYGQKNIQNSEFARVYFKCMYSHGRRCRAKKHVQQRDNSSRSPTYQVTYVNEHTCHQVLPHEPTRAPPTLTPTVKNNSTTRSGNFDHPQHQFVDGNAELDNEIMICALTTVIGGAPSSPSSLPWPPPLESSRPRDSPSTYMPGGACFPSQVDVSMDLLDETFILPGSPLSPVEGPAAPWSPVSPPLPVQVRSSHSASYVPAPAVGRYWSTMDPMPIEEIFPPFSPVTAQSMSQYCWDDMPMAVTRFPDSTSAWPQDN